MAEHARVFDPDEGCPFEDCRHSCRCVAIFRDPNERRPDDPHVPLVDLEHELGKSGASNTGETGGKAFAVCMEWLPIETEEGAADV